MIASSGWPASRWWNKILTDLWQFESHRLWLYFCDVRADSRSSSRTLEAQTRESRPLGDLLGWLPDHPRRELSVEELAAPPVRP